MAVLVVLVAFSVLNTQLMSVLERTREFGVIMALGLTPRGPGPAGAAGDGPDGVAGPAAGRTVRRHRDVGISSVMAFLPGHGGIGRQIQPAGRMFPRLTPYTLLLGPVVVFGFSLLAAVYPALRLLRLATGRGHESGLMRLLPVIAAALSWRNLWRNHRRTLIMLLAITIGVWAMIFMTALMRGMVDQMITDGIPAARSYPGTSSGIPRRSQHREQHGRTVGCLLKAFNDRGCVAWTSRVTGAGGHVQRA